LEEGIPGDRTTGGDEEDLGKDVGNIDTCYGKIRIY